MSRATPLASGAINGSNATVTTVVIDINTATTRISTTVKNNNAGGNTPKPTSGSEILSSYGSIWLKFSSVIITIMFLECIWPNNEISMI